MHNPARRKPSRQNRASIIRTYIVDYLTDLNQHMLKGQTYDEACVTAHNDDKLATLVQFGLSRPSSPYAGLTPLQAKLITLDATARYSPDMRRSSSFSDNDVQSRQTRRVTSKMIRQTVTMDDGSSLPKGVYEREMATARLVVAANVGLS